jgi:lysophospholipase L1-like esterase
MQSANQPRWGRSLPFGQRGGLAVVGGAIVIIGLVAAIVGRSVWAGSAASPTPAGSQPANTTLTTTTATATPVSSPAPSPSATSPAPTAEPTAKPAAPKSTAPLPSLLAAIGDSYSQAYSVSPSYLGNNIGFSWVIGSTRNDGVFSLYERFKTIGGAPVVVDAATSGRQMKDAPRQANLVVAAAKMLKPGQTAYVTFELGTNDLCADPDPKTDPVSFERDLATAIATLRSGLPVGSRILMLSVPDFPHFHDITQVNPAALANLALPENSNRCPPYLGDNGPFSMAQANDYLTRYDAALKGACRGITATDSPSGKLYCTYNATLLADTDFLIGDLSTVDYFHPSLSGQARMAADAWAADVWSSVPIPKGAAQ